MLTLIPTEISLAILAFIPLRQLCRLQQVSNVWNAFFAVNESSIYRAAAILHDFVPSKASLEDAKQSHVPWLDGVRSWKDLCEKHYAMEMRWEGSGQARHTVVGAAGQTVHRFKVDEEQRTVIATFSNGGLRVCAIEEDEILWWLPQTEVHPFAHCEYSAGFLVLTRSGGNMEVWRRKRDVRPNPRPSMLNLDSRQERANQLARQSQKSISEADRGAFVPWTTILPPQPVHASRLVHHTLLIASPIAQEAYLYDVLSGRLTQTISLEALVDPQGSPLGIYYVELGARHIFVCSKYDVLILPRGAGSTNSSFKFPTQVGGLYTLYEYPTLFTEDDDLGVAESLSGRDSTTLTNCPFVERDVNEVGNSAFPRNFTAVHVSPCGSHFVAVDERGCLYIVRNFEDALSGRRQWPECVWIMHLQSPISHLAFEYDKRVTFHVKDLGIFVIPFVSADHVSANTLDMLPHMPYPCLLHARDVDTPDINTDSSCVQLTRRELWFTWMDLHAIRNTGSMKLHYIDFST